MKDHEAFLRFIEADVAQLSGFFLRQFLAAEDLFREWIGEAFDHQCDCNPKREQDRRNRDFDGGFVSCLNSLHGTARQPLSS